MCEQQGVKAMLRHYAVTQGLAHIDAPGLGRYLTQYFGTVQTGVYHHSGVAQPVQRTQSHAIQRTRTRPYDANKTKGSRRKTFSHRKLG